MRLLNAIDAAMTHADLVKASSSFVGICRLQHGYVQSFKAGERGRDVCNRPFNAHNSPGKRPRWDPQRDRVGIVRKVALFGGYRHDFDKIARKAGIHVRSPGGSGRGGGGAER